MNWDLSKLYTGFDDPAFARDMRLLEEKTRSAQAWINGGDMPKSDADKLCRVITVLQEAQALRTCLSNYIQLTLAADSNCEAALAPRNRLNKLANELELFASAADHLIGAMDGLETLGQGNALIDEHRAWILEARNRSQHLIDPALEPTVLTMQLTGGKAWCRLRDELGSGLMVDVEIDGDTRHLPLSSARALAMDTREEVRAAAYAAELAAYPRIEVPMAACLNGIKGEALTICKLRHYDSVLAWSLDQSRMDADILAALLQAMESSLPLFRRYFRIKSAFLGHPGPIRFYNLFAPLGGSSTVYTPDTARDLLLEVFGSYNPDIAVLMQRAFAERWIDMYPRPGKEGGAFCEGVHPLGMSYVLTNFDGNFSDVSTLAHELGHAYNDLRMSEGSILNTDVPMPLAETASTFNELLLAERMLKTADRDAELALLDQQIGDAAQVIVDILSRYRFESEVLRRRENSTLSARELCEIMLNAQRETYGDGMDDDFRHPYMWACKPHYYFTDYHFYNFPYAFGQLFGTGLFAQWQEKGSAFWPLYDRLLRLSGSGSVREVTRAAGIEAADPQFWASSLSLFAQKVDRLEALAGQ